MRVGRIIVLGCLLEMVCWADPGLAIQIQISNQYGVPEKRLLKALSVAGAILGEAGVTPRWLDCSDPARSAANPKCHVEIGPSDVFLRFASRKNIPSASNKHSLMGYAMIPPGKFAVLATVFPDVARQKADQAFTRWAIVLGHAIAHEIGHLLLGRAGHSSDGLMKGVWSPADLMRATADPMKFTERESRRMKQNVRGRAEMKWGLTH